MGSNPPSSVRLTALVRGQVQGVGFRWWTRSKARALGLVGTVVNRPDGSVDVVAEGPEPACTALLAALRSGGTPGLVDAVDVRWGAATGEHHAFVAR